MKKNTFSIFYLLLMLSVCLTARAETINFESVLEKAIDNSYDLQIANIDIDISKKTEKEAKSEYFPNITTGLNSGHSNDLTDGLSTVTPVGNTVLVDGSRYQNSLYMGVSYNFWDFGVRKRKLNLARKDISLKSCTYDQDLLDLKLKLVDLYGQALLTYRELKTKEEILPVYQEISLLKQKLYESGLAAKTQTIDDEIQALKLSNHISFLKSELKSTLRDISFYTQEDYDIENVELLNFGEARIIPVSNTEQTNKNKLFHLQVIESDNIAYEKFPEYKIFDLEIEKQKLELEILKRETLPKFGFYTNYYFYGADKTNYFSSFGNLEDRNLSFGISSSMPVFDGFRNKANREKVQLQISKLELEKRQKLHELKSLYEKLSEKLAFYRSHLKNQEKTLVLMKNKLAMIERLDDQKLIDKPTLLNQKVEMVNQNLDLEKTRINNQITLYKLKILSEVTE